METYAKILVLGDSGSGKTSAIDPPSSYIEGNEDYECRLKPEETIIISSHSKSLPIKGYKKKYTPVTLGKKTVKLKGGGSREVVYVASGNLAVTETLDGAVSYISAAIQSDCKNIIIDDFQFWIAKAIFDRVEDKGYDKFTELASKVMVLLTKLSDNRIPKNIIIITHSEFADDKANLGVKMQTSSKMIDKYYQIEGLFQYVVYATTDLDGNYSFRTNRIIDKERIKTTAGVFDLYIPNNYQYMINKIKKYEEE